MQFIHSRDCLEAGTTVRVDCDHQCNVLVLDDINFARFKRRARHEYFGGFYTHLPALIDVPRSDHWNVVLHLGGGRANLRYNISYLG